MSWNGVFAQPTSTAIMLGFRHPKNREKLIKGIPSVLNTLIWNPISHTNGDIRDVPQYWSVLSWGRMSYDARAFCQQYGTSMFICTYVSSNQSYTRKKDRKSLSVRPQRTPTYPPCPVYTLGLLYLILRRSSPDVGAVDLTLVYWRTKLSVYVYLLSWRDSATAHS